MSNALVISSTLDIVPNTFSTSKPKERNSLSRTSIPNPAAFMTFINFSLKSSSNFLAVRPKVISNLAFSAANSAACNIVCLVL